MRRAQGEGGFTLIELILAVVILGVVMGPITASIIVGLKTTDKTQAALSDGTAADLINVYLAPDVQNTNPADRLAVPPESTEDCRGPGSAAAIVFNHAGGVTVSYSVEAVDGEPALIRRDSAGGCGAQVIAPGLATGYTLSGGNLVLNCGTVTGSCTGDTYTDLKRVSVVLTTPTGHSVTVRATTRT